MPLNDLVEEFVFEVCAGKTNETPSAYRSKLQHLLKYFGEDEKIDQAKINKFRIYFLERDTKIRGGKEVKGKLSKFTIRSVFATTRHFLHWGASRGYFPQGVDIQNIKEPVPDPKPVEQLTVELLLKAAGNMGEEWERIRNIALIYVLRDTGGRVGAISKIDLDRLDLANAMATAPDKNDQMALLFFNQPTVTVIKDWLMVRPQLKPKDYYLWTGCRGFGLKREGIARVLSKLAVAGGATGRHNAHAFRHAFARDSILAGADLGQVSDMMGHHGIVVTHKYYGRWTKKELKDFHRKFSPGRNLPLPSD